MRLRTWAFKNPNSGKSACFAETRLYLIFLLQELFAPAGELSPPGQPGSWVALAAPAIGYPDCRGWQAEATEKDRVDEPWWKYRENNLGTEAQKETRAEEFFLILIYCLEFFKQLNCHWRSTFAGSFWTERWCGDATPPNQREANVSCRANVTKRLFPAQLWMRILWLYFWCVLCFWKCNTISVFGPHSSLLWKSTANAKINIWLILFQSRSMKLALAS